MKRVTGRPLSFARFRKGGNLISINLDLELAQILGIAESMLNNPDAIDWEFFGINKSTLTPEALASYFMRACLAHAKR